MTSSDTTQAAAAPDLQAGRASPELSSSDLDVRPIRADDKQALKAGFERLSETSRYRRFLSPHDELSDEELRYFTEIDHHNHEALVALNPQTGEGVGVARYVRSEDDPHVAELAIAVVDDWQRRGVGTRLATALADRAREEGITIFTGLVLADNQLMLNLAEELGRAHTGPSEQGTVELAIDLPEHGPGQLMRWLRAVATGDLRVWPLHQRPS
jgi:GNAT superfamily N-acetyltransferase